MQDIKQQAKVMFRKLWGGINKDNQHLTTEKIEDLLDTVVTLAVKQERERVDNWVRKNYSRSSQPLYAHVDLANLLKLINER